MQVGTFSISLAVKDLQASKVFYEKFGFMVFAGDAFTDVRDLQRRLKSEGV